MTSNEIRDAFQVLGLEPTLDLDPVKRRFRTLVLQNSSDLVRDPEEKRQRDTQVFRITQARDLCIAFCRAGQTLEDLEAQEDRSSEEEDRKRFQTQVTLFIGHLLKRRFTFWTRVSLADSGSIPSFGPTVPKYRAENTARALFHLIDEETAKPEIQWICSFESDPSHPIAWIPLAKTDGTHEALVFFHVPPLLTRTLPSQTETKQLIGSLASQLKSTSLYCLRIVRGSQHWSKGPHHPLFIRIHAGGAQLVYRYHIGTKIFPFILEEIRTPKNLESVLPRWEVRIQRGR